MQRDPPIQILFHLASTVLVMTMMGFGQAHGMDAETRSLLEEASPRHITIPMVDPDTRREADTGPQFLFQVPAALVVNIVGTASGSTHVVVGVWNRSLDPQRVSRFHFTQCADQSPESRCVAEERRLENARRVAGGEYHMSIVIQHSRLSEPERDQALRRAAGIADPFCTFSHDAGLDMLVHYPANDHRSGQRSGERCLSLAGGVRLRGHPDALYPANFIRIGSDNLAKFSVRCRYFVPESAIPLTRGSAPSCDLYGFTDDLYFTISIRSDDVVHSASIIERVSRQVEAWRRTAPESQPAGN